MLHPTDRSAPVRGSAGIRSPEWEEPTLEAPSAAKLLERGVLSRAQLIWQVYPRRPALPWTGGVSYRIGALVAALVLPFGTSPNLITLSGLAVHALGATILIAAPSPAPWPVAVVVLAVWQIAFGLDCADGLVARATGRQSGYGAWLDQVVDVASHAFVFMALGISAARGLQLDASAGIALTVWALGCTTLLGHAAGLKGYTIGAGRSISREATGRTASLGSVLVITDYGAVLVVAAVLTVAPPALAAFLIAEGAACATVVAIQAWRFRAPPPA